MIVRPLSIKKPVLAGCRGAGNIFPPLYCRRLRRTIRILWAVHRTGQGPGQRRHMRFQHTGQQVPFLTSNGQGRQYGSGGLHQFGFAEARQEREIAASHAEALGTGDLPERPEGDVDARRVGRRL